MGLEWDPKVAQWGGTLIKSHAEWFSMKIKHLNITSVNRAILSLDKRK